MAATVLPDLNDRMRELVETVDEMDLSDLDSAAQCQVVGHSQRLYAPASQKNCWNVEPLTRYLVGKTKPHLLGTFDVSKMPHGVKTILRVG